MKTNGCATTGSPYGRTKALVSTTVNWFDITVGFRPIKSGFICSKTWRQNPKTCFGASSDFLAYLKTSRVISSHDAMCPESRAANISRN